MRWLLEFTNGQQVSLITKGLIGMIRPSAGFQLFRRGIIAADSNYLGATGPCLHFGNIVSSYEGIVFQFYNVDLKAYAGPYRLFFVQLGNTHGRQCVGTNETRCRWSGYGLDGASPYLNLYFGNSPTGESSDSPFMELHGDATSAYRGNSFDVWLMFEASLTDLNSIPVPLSRASWSWNSSAVKTNDNWVLTNPVYPANQIGTSTLIFPQWQINIHDTLWLTNAANCVCQ